MSYKAMTNSLSVNHCLAYCTFDIKKKPSSQNKRLKIMHSHIFEKRNWQTVYE